MTKQEILDGLAENRTLIQEEWADLKDIRLVDELISEGKAEATQWRYYNEFQCLVRRVTKPKRPPP